MNNEATENNSNEGFFGHPIGLRPLFLTEMWERMSYYGMRALLVLYMTGALTGFNPGLGWSSLEAQAIYGIYVGMVYFMVIPGGWLADNLLGHQKAVLYGAIIIALGHFTLALPMEQTFFLGLIFVVLGTGLLKGNISTIVGKLYREDDERRESGYTIFYMAINIGSTLGFLVCSYLGEKIGWHWGFGAAGIGMTFGVIQFIKSKSLLGSAGAHPNSIEEGRRSKLVTWTKVSSAERSELTTDDGQPDPAVVFSWSRTIGLWIAALGTLAIMSFLWGDNVFYKLAEAVVVGASAPYAMVVGFWTGIIQNLFGKLIPSGMRDTVLPGLPSTQHTEWIYVIPLVLSVLMLWRLAPAGGWISRWPLAFFIGATAGIRLVAYLDADFVQQISNTIMPLIVSDNKQGLMIGSSIANFIIVTGVLTCLVYFFFSFEHTGAVGTAARVGIWFLMITFGAGFGFTVMGRIALISDRFNFLFYDWLWLPRPGIDA